MGAGQVIALILALASVAGLIYQLAAALLLRRFKDSPRPSPHLRPTVSVLKPLCGDEPHLADNLAAVCRQDYPGLQVVCGVADPHDPAVAVVERLRGAAEGVDLQVVIDGRRHGCNLKVGNLLNMLPQARNDVLVIADSDVHSDHLYLDDVVAPLAQPKVGLVTCLYVGRPAEGLWSRLGAMGINHGFLPSALVARALGRKDGCFGATMALRRDVLSQIGGLEPLSDVLADDWALGAAVRRAGWEIAVAARPVDLVVHEPNLRSLVDHEVRWGRTIAAVDRASYLASVITQPVALALLAALAGGWPFLALPALAAAGRLWAVRAEERALGLAAAPLGLVALREGLSFLVYVIAACGRSVLWRGRRFRIRRDGTMELLEGMSI